MKQTIFGLCFLLSCWITAPSAQRTEPAHNVYVLTGCLERGTAPSSFRLTRAATVGQAPQRPSASADTEADVYELQAATSVSELGLSNEKLQPEVGTRVHVTIRPVEATASPAPTQPASSNRVEKPVESPRQRYTVITLERLADSCK